MKKFLILAICVAMIAPLFNSCKKGENDPFLSFSSRAGRISGEWTLSGQSITSISTDDSYSSTTVSTYAGTVMTTTTTTTNSGTTFGPYTDTETYTETLTIEKDGTFSFVTTSGEDIDQVDGAWYFAGKSKALDLKDKEAIVFTGLTYGDGSTVSTTYAGTISPDMVYYIDQLKSSEMIIITDVSRTESDGSTYTSNGTTTYTKK